jgi:hypothetical protein
LFDGVTNRMVNACTAGVTAVKFVGQIGTVAMMNCARFPAMSKYRTTSSPALLLMDK